LSPLTAAILAWLLAQPPYSLDHETPRARAERMAVIASAATLGVEQSGFRGDKVELTAAVLTTWQHESHFALHIHADRCRAHECDNGKAKTLGQLHVTRSFPREQWQAAAGLGLAATTDAARETARLLGSHLVTCAKRGTPGWGHAMALYGTGRTCQHAKLEARAKGMARVIARLRGAK